MAPKSHTLFSGVLHEVAEPSCSLSQVKLAAAGTCLVTHLLQRRLQLIAFQKKLIHLSYNLKITLAATAHLIDTRRDEYESWVSEVKTSLEVEQGELKGSEYCFRHLTRKLSLSKGQPLFHRTTTQNDNNVFKCLLLQSL